MRNDDYCREALRQLTNPLFYKQIDTPIYPRTAAAIKKIIKSLSYQGFLSKAQVRFLLPPTNPRPRHFYLLPKIHKDPASWPFPHVSPPGRPIVSGCSSESAAAEAYIDSFLQPIAANSPSFIRDSSHFKARIADLSIKDSDIFFTLDVESLYTNIPIIEGIQCVKEALSSHPLRDRPDKYILQLLDITLFNNDFKFDCLWFLQIKGTAMGKKYAPSYANIYMHSWESQALAAYRLAPSIWLRYIDDIFGIWPHSLSELLLFVEFLNSRNPHIKVSLSFSSTSIDFLDCTAFKLNQKIATKIFSKPTDCQLLLHPLSFHPKHTFSGIIKSQFLRFLRLSTLWSDFQQSANKLSRYLLSIGYSRVLIRSCKLAALRSSGCFNNHTISGCNPCDRCSFCPFVNSTPTIQGNTPNSKFIILQNTSCNSTNIIYCINCTLCPHTPALYVGETRFSCKKRLSQHLHDIKNNNPTAISSHFNSPSHNSSHLRITVIQSLPLRCQDPNLTTTHRISAESRWINRLSSLKPIGLNSHSSPPLQPTPFVLPFCNTAIYTTSLVRDAIAASPRLASSLHIIPAYSKQKSLHFYLSPTTFSAVSDISELSPPPSHPPS